MHEKRHSTINTEEGLFDKVSKFFERAKDYKKNRIILIHVSSKICN